MFGESIRTPLYSAMPQFLPMFDILSTNAKSHEKPILVNNVTQTAVNTRNFFFVLPSDNY